MRRFSINIILLLVILMGGAALATQRGDVPFHWLLQIAREGGAVQLVSSKRVESPLPKQRHAARVYPWRLQILLEDAVLFTRGMGDPRVVRGAFTDDADPSKIEGVRLEQEDYHFLVRLPDLEACRRSPCRLRVEAVGPDGRAHERIVDMVLPRLGGK
jgi:hypothetical protein